MIPSIADLRIYFDQYIFCGGHETIRWSIEIGLVLFRSIEIAVDAIDSSESARKNTRYISAIDDYGLQYLVQGANTLHQS